MKNKIIFSAFLIVFTISSNLFSQNTPNQTNRTFIKIEVKGLACPYCAYGLEKDLKKVEGIDFIEIELKEGLVYTSVPTDLKPTEEKLKKVVEDSGFTAGDIEFSEQPFEKNFVFGKKKKRAKNR